MSYMLGVETLVGYMKVYITYMAYLQLDTFVRIFIFEVCTAVALFE